MLRARPARCAGACWRARWPGSSPPWRWPAGAWQSVPPARGRAAARRTGPAPEPADRGGQRRARWRAERDAAERSPAGQPLSGLYWQIDRLDDQGRTVMRGRAFAVAVGPDAGLARRGRWRLRHRRSRAASAHHADAHARRKSPVRRAPAGGGGRHGGAGRAGGTLQPHAADRVGRAGGGPDGRCGGAGAGGIASAAARAAGLAAWRQHHPDRGRFPSEIQPLVEDFNRVLAVNADMVQRARTQAGNLAHAVKTP